MNRYITFSLCLFIATPALAMSDGQFEQDRKFAERSITHAQQKVCLDDFSAKMAQPVDFKPAGRFHFNAAISRNVYDKLYWNGASRGVAFTLPVTVKDPALGEAAGNVACFYALTDKGIAFQHSQQVTWSYSKFSRE